MATTMVRSSPGIKNPREANGALLCSDQRSCGDCVSGSFSSLSRASRKVLIRTGSASGIYVTTFLAHQWIRVMNKMKRAD